MDLIDGTAGTPHSMPESAPPPPPAPMPGDGAPGLDAPELAPVMDDVVATLGAQQQGEAYTETDALDTLDANWDDINGSDDIVSEKDLRDIAGGDDADLSRAAQYYLDNPDDFAALDTALRGGNGDTKVSSDDIRSRREQLDPDYTELDAIDALVGQWDSLNGADAIVSAKDLRRYEGQDSEVGRAARFYRDNPEKFAALETAAHGGWGDTKLSINDIRARQQELGFDAGPQQISTHNSYERGASLTEQFENEGVRSFELDIHDNAGGDATADGEWSVRHFGWQDSTGDLSTYLEEIDGLETDEPITLFIDVKSTLGSEGHSPADLDALLEKEFGDRLYTTDDLIARAQEIDPDVSTVAEAVQVAGWPSEDELNGRIIVSITGKGLDDYHNAERPDGSGPGAFIAPSPDFVDGEFVPNEDVAIYNVNANPLGPDLNKTERDTVAGINQAVTDEGFLIRNYRVDENNVDQVIASGATFIGTDFYEEIDVE